MSWLWSSEKEYEQRVQPYTKTKPAFWRAQEQTEFQNLQRLTITVESIVQAGWKLRDLGYTAKEVPENNEHIQKAHREVIEIIYNGEDLLLLHKRLAASRWAEDFICYKDIFEEWKHYAEQDTFGRNLAKFLESVDTLLLGFDHFLKEDETLFKQASSLPEFLSSDFKLARDLFSVGFDEVGALVVGRGLEGVLRHFAAHKDVSIRNQGKSRLASEADFKDLIEVFYRLRWRKDKSRVIDQDTKSLLDLLRTVRNSTAHPKLRRQQANWRELATVMSSTADELWKDCQRERAQLVSKIVDKDW